MQTEENITPLYEPSPEDRKFIDTFYFNYQCDYGKAYYHAYINKKAYLRDYNQYKVKGLEKYREIERQFKDFVKSRSDDFSKLMRSSAEAQLSKLHYLADICFTNVIADDESNVINPKLLSSFLEITKETNKVLGLYQEVAEDSKIKDTTIKIVFENPRPDKAVSLDAEYDKLDEV